VDTATKYGGDKIEFIDNKLFYDDQLFYYVENYSSLKVEHLVGYDAIILDAQDADFTKILLKKFRSNNNPEFYLKPIYLINYKETNDPFVNHLHDGILLSMDQIPEKITLIRELFVRTTHLDNHPSNSFEVQTLKKVFNYMYTREIKSLSPIPDVSSSIGYSYPILSVNFDNFEESKVLDLLEWATREDLIWPDFYDRIYLCNNCGSGHLSYREMCPACDSSNMKSEDLIHHFSCGNIGPISDFKNGIDSSLTCMKCSKSLRHIGVDYDKPSIINHCLNCNENFQDYIVKAKCVYCKADTEVQYLLSKNLSILRQTKKGRNAAISGIVTADYNLADDIHGAVSMSVFTTMMHYELERIKHNNTLTTNFSVLYIENIFELLKKLGKTKEKTFLTELVHMIREGITPADFISISNPSVIAICINDTLLINAQVMVQKVSDKIEEMVFNNFNKFQLVIHSKTVELGKTESFEKQFGDITRELTEHNV